MVKQKFEHNGEQPLWRMGDRADEGENIIYCYWGSLQVGDSKSVLEAVSRLV